MIIRFLGTANAESSDTRMVSLLVDDVLAVDAGSLTSGLSFTEQKKIKAILISHGHYDHIRDIPAFAFNNFLRTTRVYSTSETLEIISTHLIDGIIYPRFAGEAPFLKKPALELLLLEPLKPMKIEGYQVLPVPVNHPVGAVGFEITSKNGEKVFYTGDAGAGLANCWQYTSPDLLIAELTFPNSMKKTALDSGHLCPELLKNELIEFSRTKGYLPRVALIHVSPHLKEEISREMLQMGKELDISFNIAADGEKLTVQVTR